MRMAGQTWWRGTVRAERQKGELLDDLRDERKREADTKLLLQPVEDPNERKRKPGERREGRDGRMYELCELRADAQAGAGGGPSSSAAAESGADQTAVGGEVVDDLQLGSVAAVREWMLVTKATGATAAADAAQAAERRRGERSSTRATAGTAASFTAGGGDGDNDDDDEEADATDGRQSGKRRTRRPKPRCRRSSAPRSASSWPRSGRSSIGSRTCVACCARSFRADGSW